jgi:hypothetical protein
MKNTPQKVKPEAREARDDPEQEPDESEDLKRCPCAPLTNQRLLAAGPRTLEAKHMQDAVSRDLQWIGGISATLCHRTDETQKLPEPTAPGLAAGLYTSTGMLGYSLMFTTVR